jgi:threonine/homoserine efflux transporter RhtA
MGTTALILVVAALILALIEAFEPWQRPWVRPHLGWLAMAAYFGSLLAGIHL